MTQLHGKQTITIHILPNVSRSKDNQTKKLDQLMEYKMRNIFLKSRTENVVEKSSPYPSLKNQN